jgi:hypothetical protein
VCEFSTVRPLLLLNLKDAPWPSIFIPQFAGSGGWITA